MDIQQSPIIVIGAGSWGTALALLMAKNGNAVRLWGHDPEKMHAMQQHRENQQYLPGFSFPENIEVRTDLAESLSGVVDILIAVPSHCFREVLESLKPYVNSVSRIVWGTKGVDPNTCQLLHEVVEEVFFKGIKFAVLSGPSFAKELAAENPTAVSLAGNDDAFLQSLVERLHNDRFRVYINSDIIGVELCGAIKNVLAIAVGVSDGLNLGANARCALITRGLAEMSRLCEAMGGQRDTMLSLCGVGDLVLTCTDDQSRNRRFGLALARGVTAEDAISTIGQAVEGLHNASQVNQLAKQYHVDMPICEQVYAVTHLGHEPQDVLQELLERKPKFE